MTQQSDFFRTIAHISYTQVECPVPVKALMPKTSQADILDPFDCKIQLCNMLNRHQQYWHNSNRVYEGILIFNL